MLSFSTKQADCALASRPSFHSPPKLRSRPVHKKSHNASTSVVYTPTFGPASQAAPSQPPHTSIAPPRPTPALFQNHPLGPCPRHSPRIWPPSYANWYSLRCTPLCEWRPMTYETIYLRDLFTFLQTIGRRPAALYCTQTLASALDPPPLHFTVTFLLVDSIQPSQYLSTAHAVTSPTSPLPDSGLDPIDPRSPPVCVAYRASPTPPPVSLARSSPVNACVSTVLPPAAQVVLFGCVVASAHLASLEVCAAFLCVFLLFHDK